MKLTNKELMQIIKEELQNLINEEEIDNEEEFGRTEQDDLISEFRSWLKDNYDQVKIRKYAVYRPDKLKQILEEFYEQTKNSEVYNAVIDGFKLNIEKK